MKEILERIEKKVDGNTEAIDKIRDNDLHHIYSKIGDLTGQNKILIGLSISSFILILGLILGVIFT